MKIASFTVTCIMAALFFCCNMVNAQELSKGYKANIEMNADEKGDITVLYNIKYNASTWDFVKQQHGTDPSVLKNNIKRQFPKYELTEFDVKNDDMERTSSIKFKILGSLKVDASGKWLADLETKNPDITKISETQFLIVDEENAQTSKINLPKSASDAKIEKDSFGKAILTYTAPVSGGGFGNIVKYLGFLIAAAGGFLWFKNRQQPAVVVSQTQQQKVNYPQPRQIDDAVIVNQPGQQNLHKGNHPDNGQ